MPCGPRWPLSEASVLSGAGQLGDERRGVERVEAEPAGDVLGRGPRALGEQPTQDLAGLGAPPPVLADLAAKVHLELRRADPGARVVGGIEACVHVGQVAAGVVAK